VDIRIFNTPDDTARAVAGRVVDALRQQPDLVLGIPAGRTPLGAYAELRRLHAVGKADFSRAHAFTVDEFVGVDRSHPSSFRQFLSTHLFGEVNIPADCVHSLDGAAEDLGAECERYEREIARAGGVDLQLLGVGGNGHIGFNEPGEALVAHTHRTALLDTTRRDNAPLFGGDESKVPREALTIGIGTILGAAAILLMAVGVSKADAVAQMINGPVTSRLPASFLQLHRKVEVYLDRAAASQLRSAS
jgi:glucosamine-6-phosphate deaminase